MPEMTLDQCLENGPFAWPGGYPCFGLCADNEAICFDCIKSNADQIREAMAAPDRHNKEWTIEAYEIHYEGDSIFCAHCNAEIESAYGPLEEEEQPHDMSDCNCPKCDPDGVCE